MSLDLDQLANILEACLLVSGKPMSMSQLEGLFEHEIDKPDKDQIGEAIAHLQQGYATRGIELVEVASGFRLQSRQSMAQWVMHMYQEKTPRYSRALMETLVLIAYRQPITRGEIEDVRGVAVSSNIIKTLLEREWVRVLGHRDVPGRPAILGTTKQFLDYFNLKRIDELPTLSEIKALDQIDPELAHEMALLDAAEDSAAAESDGTEADVTEADVTEADVMEADVMESDVMESDVMEADVMEADVMEADVMEADANDYSAETTEAIDDHQDVSQDAALAGQSIEQVDVDKVDVDLGADEADEPEDADEMAEASSDDSDIDQVNEDNDDSSGEFAVPAELTDADSTAHEPMGLTEVGRSETLH